MVSRKKLGAQEKDLNFVSGVFFDVEIPRDKKYLLKYFTTDIQIAFLKYHLVFGNHVNFIDHTGVFCTQRLLNRFALRLREIQRLHKEARLSFTEEGLGMMELIESGKLPLTNETLSAKI